MKKIKHYNLIRGVLWCLLIVAMSPLGGCRGIGPEPTAERLRNRVEGFIEARNAMNREAMAKFYLDPKQARIGNINFRDSRIEDIDIKGEKARVTLKNSFMVMGFNFKNVAQRTNWVWQNGDWYLVIPRNNSPFGNRNESGKERKQ